MLLTSNARKRIHDLVWKFCRATRESFWFDLSNDLRIKLYYDSTLSYLIYFSEFEKAEQHFTKVFLRQGDVFVDVGANIGLFSLIASRIVGEKGKVYAFEPARTTFRRLNENLELNNISNTKAIRRALSDKKGKQTLRVSLDGYDAWNSFGASLPGTHAVGETVDLVTLDQFCDEHDLVDRLNMVKIDVEGWEKYVLQGAEKILASERAPLLMVEFAKDCVRKAGTSCQELYEQIASFGYTLYQYDAESNQLTKEKPGREYEYINLICLKSEQAKQRLAKIVCDS